MSDIPEWVRDEELLLKELKGGRWADEPEASTDTFAAAKPQDADTAPRQAGLRAAPRIAGYEDLVELGHGGQGVVYSAVQQSTQRRVAVKVLLGGAWAPDKHRRRFDREVKLIARLQHPNIVRLYDSGLTSEGYPYYVMEFIEGVGLDELISAILGGQPWVLSGYEHLAVVREDKPKQRAPSGFATRSALELLVKVCEAVGYAHQRGMVHRDLKPSNIRVDPGAEPHVLDFGLAKHILGATAEGTGTQVSLSGEFMGSLAWASPEQTEGIPARIDARADVYSLGVILFQMLTGQFPYPVVGGFQEILDRIKNTEPRRPSALRKDLDDELDTIVLKCLAKEPDRRYRDANELARDIRHYLAAEPIEARSESVPYRLRKRLRRYRLAATLVVALVALAGMSVLTAWTAWRTGAGPEGASRAHEDEPLPAGADDAEVCRVYEVAKLRPSDVEPADLFGFSVAIAQDPVWRIVVGAPDDDDQGVDSGSAYVYRFDGASWVWEAKLLASDGREGAGFGRPVRLSGDTILVNAYGSKGPGENPGAAYIFEHDGSTWVEQAKLFESEDGQRIAAYGPVLHGDMVADCLRTPDDVEAGITPVRIFVRSEGEMPEEGPQDKWVERAVLMPADGWRSPGCWVMAMSEDVLVVYAQGCEEGRADCEPSGGAAYIFRRDPGQAYAWHEEARLTAPDGHPADRFGRAAAVEGDLVVIGAPSNDVRGKNTGAGYVYRFDGEDWVEEAQLETSDPSEQQQFGISLDVENGLIIVGAYGDDENGYGAGAVYVYRFDGDEWVEEAKLLASDGKPKDVLGYSVSLAGDTAVAGAFYERGADYGSAYVFRGLSDCNANGELDACEVAGGVSRDRNANGVPDECEPFPTKLSQNTTGEPDETFLGPPDDTCAGIGTAVVEYDFGAGRVIDGDGPDFNVYEFESGRVEFDLIDVQVSEKGSDYATVAPTRATVVRIPGDGARGTDLFIRSFDLAGSGLSSVRYIRIAGTGDGHAANGTGFELDAIGVIHLAPAKGE